MIDWLSTRLTPSKFKEPRWVEFSKVLEKLWEEFFDPDMSRLERLRSSYSADDVDLVKKIREMGDYFSFDWPKKDDRPIALSWRRLELEYKDLELILNSNIRRHFGRLPVAWLPIFAPLDQPYGVGFKVAEGPYPERELMPPDGMFLTSRGWLGVDFSHLMRIGMTRAEFREKGVPIVRRVKPLHILFEGLLWYIYFELPFDADFDSGLLYWERETIPYELQFTVLGSRFDYTAADSMNLDLQTALCTWQRENWQTVPFFPHEYIWTLDFHLPFGLPAGWLPLDVIISGNESRSFTACSLAAVINDSHLEIDGEIPLTSSQEKIGSPVSDEFSADLSEHNGIDMDQPVAADFECLPHLDFYPHFDAFQADLFPLDMPVAGRCYA